MSLLPGSAISSGGYNINNSLRFRGSATPILSRTPSVAGDRKTWTWSAWVKRGGLGATNYRLFSCVQDGNNQAWIRFPSGDTIQVASAIGGVGEQANLITTALFRDPAAWYHIVVVFNTTSATASNRVQLYVNGVRITAFTTAIYPAQNYDGFINTTTIHRISTYDGSAEPFDGYMAEVNFVNAQALTPSSFGETNATTGVWQPKQYTGTYGTNGFYLKFSNTSEFPELVNTTSASQTNAAQATITVNVPSGVANGDLLILVLNGGNSTVYTTPAGWTLWFATTNVTAVFYKTASSEPASYTVTGSTATTAIGFMLAYRNAAINVMGALSATTANPIVAPAITTTATNTVVIAFIRNGGVSETFTTPSGFTNLVSESDASDPSGAIFTKTQVTAGTTGTASSTPTSTAGRGIQFSIRPLSLGQDFSGNNNYWNTNNISLTAGTTYDAMTDSPTLTSATVGNYCVLNPIDRLTTATLSNANLAFTTATTGHNAIGSIGMTSGKYYWEAQTSAGTTQARATVYGTAASAYYSFAANNAVYGFRFDADAGTLDYTTNGSSFTSLATGLTSRPYFPYFNNNGTTSKTISVNFGQRPFTYTLPTGYNRLNTFNLPTSTIVKGNSYMDATLYTGTGVALSVTNAGAFRPDLVWIKSRSTATDNAVYDAVRGTTRELVTNDIVAETTQSGSLTAFNSNGFTIGTRPRINTSATTYVAWQWQAGSSTVTNTSGTISAQVRADTTTGFSIVTYTGTGANATVGHGLGVAPKMIIVKNRGSAVAWAVWHTSIANTQYLVLNTNAGVATGATWWNSTTPTSSVFSVGTSTSTNTSTNTYVAYCWAEIAGFSKFGSYTGNGSADGPFVYTGFRPKFLIFKRSNAAGSWYTYDSARNVSNLTNLALIPEQSVAEVTQGSTNGPIDFLSNGFKLRGSGNDGNANGGTFIYMAFAENPFKNALAR